MRAGAARGAGAHRAHAQPTARPLVACLIGLALLSHPLAPAAQEGGIWGLCPPLLPANARPEPPPSDDPEALRISADDMDLRPDGVMELRGNVVLGRDRERLYAEELRYDPQSGRVRALGGIELTSPDGFTLRGSSAEIDTASEQADVDDPEFFYDLGHARGGAERLRRTPEGVLELGRAIYTTCPAGDEDWLLSARKVELDQEAGEGTARDVVVRFKDIPFLYTPWISFPIDDRRRSGLLPPSFGSSSSSGAELSLPYYFNLAPNRDLTLTPTFLERRGLKLDAEGRYLTRRGAGQIDLQYLPDDRRFDDRRWLGRYAHRGELAEGLDAVVNYNRVSDSDYFVDLGNSLNDLSTQFLDQRLDLTYRNRLLAATARVQRYQTVDTSVAPEDRPYERLPEVRLSSRGAEGPLSYDLRGEAVRFDREAGITGQRYDLAALLGLGLDRSGYFLRTQVDLRHTDYRLDAESTAGETDLSRSLPVASLDTGLIFERAAGRRHIQTLEPRLFYLYAPRRDQDDLPVFDTSERDFSFDALFERNRFNGPDRVGDENRLTVAVTSRLLDASTGRETVSASLGQIVYFDDREVQLPGEAVEVRENSNLVANLSAAYRNWSLLGTVQWDPEIDEIARSTVGLSYRAGPTRVANLTQRLRRDDSGLTELDQIGFSVAWPLGRHWTGFGQADYSLLDDRELETLFGLEYASCCYAVRAVARRYVTPDEDTYNDTFFVQFVLKGLGNLGQGADSLLEREILGYDAIY